MKPRSLSDQRKQDALSGWRGNERFQHIEVLMRVICYTRVGDVLYLCEQPLYFDH